MPSCTQGGLCTELYVDSEEPAAFAALLGALRNHVSKTLLSKYSECPTVPSSTLSTVAEQCGVAVRTLRAGTLANPAGILANLCVRAPLCPLCGV